MLHNSKTDWVHLTMLFLIASLAGGWMIDYIYDTAKQEEAPRYFLYKVVRDETAVLPPLSDPASGYGKITVKGKLTGTDAMSASIGNYFHIDGKYLQDYANKFVEATGYLDRVKDADPGQSPLNLEIEDIKPAAENDIDDSGKICESSIECRYQCIVTSAEMDGQCPLNKSGGNTICESLTGKCSNSDLNGEEMGDMQIL